MLTYPLITSDRQAVDVQDLLAESKQWRLKYLVVARTDNQQIPMPLQTTEIIDRRPGQTGGRIYRASVSAKQILYAPTFNASDVQRLMNVGPLAMQFMGVSSWDGKALEYWQNLIDLQGASEGERGLPMLLSGQLAQSEHAGINYEFANTQGQLLGRVVDFIVRPDDGKLLYSVVQLDHGRLVPVPTDLLKLNVENKRLTAPVSLQALQQASGFDNRAAFPDFSQSHWDRSIERYWNRLTN